MTSLVLAEGLTSDESLTERVRDDIAGVNSGAPGRGEFARLVERFIPPDGIRSETDMLVSQLQNMQEFVEHGKLRWWVAGLIIEDFIQNAGVDPGDLSKTTEHKPATHQVTEYCRKCAEYCNANIDSATFNYSSFWIAWKAVREVKKLPSPDIDPTSVSVWQVNDARTASDGDPEKTEQILKDLDEGTLSQRGLKDTHWLKKNGHRDTPVAEPQFWMDGQDGTIYAQFGGNGDLEPCTPGSRGWKLVARRLRAQPLTQNKRALAVDKRGDM